MFSLLNPHSTSNSMYCRLVRIEFRGVSRSRNDAQVLALSSPVMSSFFRWSVIATEAPSSFRAYERTSFLEGRKSTNVSSATSHRSESDEEERTESWISLLHDLGFAASAVKIWYLESVFGSDFCVSCNRVSAIWTCTGLIMRPTHWVHWSAYSLSSTCAVSAHPHPTSTMRTSSVRTRQQHLRVFGTSRHKPWRSDWHSAGVSSVVQLVLNDPIWYIHNGRIHGPYLPIP